MAPTVTAVRSPSLQRSWMAIQKWTVCCGFGVNTYALARTQDARDLRGTAVNKPRAREVGIRGGIWWSSQLREMLLSSFFSVFHSVLSFFCLNVTSLTCLQWIAPLLSQMFPCASCRYFSVFSCLLASSLNVSTTFAGWLLPWSCQSLRHIPAFPFSSELQTHIFSETQIFLLGPGFSWLYLDFAGFYLYLNA